MEKRKYQKLKTQCDTNRWSRNEYQTKFRGGREKIRVNLWTNGLIEVI